MVPEETDFRKNSRKKDQHAENRSEKMHAAGACRVCVCRCAADSAAANEIAQTPDHDQFRTLFTGHLARRGGDLPLTFLGIRLEVLLALGIHLSDTI